MDDDTIKLLRECNAGIKMGVSSLEDVMEHVKAFNARPASQGAGFRFAPATLLLTRRRP